jgi:hypothetical protein
VYRRWTGRVRLYGVSGFAEYWPAATTNSSRNLLK